MSPYSFSEREESPNNSQIILAEQAKAKLHEFKKAEMYRKSELASATEHIWKKRTGLILGAIGIAVVAMVAVTVIWGLIQLMKIM